MNNFPRKREKEKFNVFSWYFKQRNVYFNSFSVLHSQIRKCSSLKWQIKIVEIPCSWVYKHTTMNFLRLPSHALVKFEDSVAHKTSNRYKNTPLYSHFLKIRSLNVPNITRTSLARTRLAETLLDKRNHGISSLESAIRSYEKPRTEENPSIGIRPPILGLFHRHSKRWLIVNASSLSFCLTLSEAASTWSPFPPIAIIEINKGFR